MKQKTNLSRVLVRIAISGLLLLTSQMAVAAGCGTTLKAVELGRLSNTLEQMNHRFMSNVWQAEFNVPSARSAMDNRSNTRALFKGVVSALRVQASIDSLAVLAQLRDMMHQPQDSATVVAAISSFAEAAADNSALALKSLRRSAATISNARVQAEIRRVLEVVGRINMRLSTCKWRTQ